MIIVVSILQMNNWEVKLLGQANFLLAFSSIFFENLASYPGRCLIRYKCLVFSIVWVSGASLRLF